MSKQITRKMIEDCKGMTQTQCAAELNVSKNTIVARVRTFGMRGFFSGGTSQNPRRGKSFYQSRTDKTPEQIAAEVGVNPEAILRQIRKLGMNKDFGIADYLTKSKRKGQDDYSYFTKTLVSCNRPECNATFFKDIDNECIDGALRMPRFICNVCQERHVETLSVATG